MQVFSEGPRHNTLTDGCSCIKHHNEHIIREEIVPFLVIVAVLSS